MSTITSTMPAVLPSIETDRFWSSNDGRERGEAQPVLTSGIVCVAGVAMNARVWIIWSLILKGNT